MCLTRKGRRALMWAFRRRTMGPDLGSPVEDEQPTSGQIRASGALLCIRRVPLSLATSFLFYHCIDFSDEYAIQSHHDRNELANDMMNNLAQINETFMLRESLRRPSIAPRILRWISLLRKHLRRALRVKLVRLLDYSI